jgi:hypothetical protein
MGQIIIPNAIKREPGYLYYIDGEGNICRSKMKSKVKETKK